MKRGRGRERKKAKTEEPFRPSFHLSSPGAKKRSKVKEEEKEEEEDAALLQEKGQKYEDGRRANESSLSGGRQSWVGLAGPIQAGGYTEYRCLKDRMKGGKGSQSYSLHIWHSC